MAKDLNQCNFIGRIGKDPEVRYMPNGDAVANFTIACGDDYKDKQGSKVERTNWIRIVAFGGLAEVIQKYCHKGSKVFISGKFTERKWQDKDGQDHFTTEIVANEMQMLDGKPSDAPQPPGAAARSYQQASGGSQQNQPPAGGFGDFDDDIPF